MKLLIASDIHGDLESTEKMLAAFSAHGCERIVLLGDILYHGPRNNLPAAYAPKEVIDLLNEKRNVILAVRGNCDTEVDQMVLDFPILADYAYILLDEISIFATHGHKYNLSSLPPLREGEVLLHGHTHVLSATEFGNKNIYLNPGSVSLPKEGNPKTYMIYENRTFIIYDFEGNEIKKIDLSKK